VPQFRAKMDMVPGMITYFWITPTRTGTFDVLCFELCGTGHYAMRGYVVVEEENAYEEWLQEQPTFAELLEEANIGTEDKSKLASSGGKADPEQSGVAR
jgi:cytochrome c oxidase subunit 2